MLTKEPGRDRHPTDPGLDRIARAAVKHDLPVNILCWGNVDAGTAEIAGAAPNTQQSSAKSETSVR
jgi:hypothetical protein